LKKRSKKLLQIASGVSFDVATRVPAETDKSFFVLFSKKNCFFLSSYSLPFRNLQFCAPTWAVTISGQKARSFVSVRRQALERRQLLIADIRFM
jgi:hypothetical protein